MRIRFRGHYYYLDDDAEVTDCSKPVLLRLCECGNEALPGRRMPCARCRRIESQMDSYHPQDRPLWRLMRP